MAYYGYIAPAEGFPRAAAAARRAIELDPDIADAHVTLGIERLFWGWDWASGGARAADGNHAEPEACAGAFGLRA